MGYKNPWFNDAYLLRFCRARKFDSEKVVLLWKNFMINRNELDIENIIPNFEAERDQAFNKAVVDYFPRCYSGVDKLGRPIFVDYSGSFKVPDLLKAVDEEKMFRYFYYTFEHTTKIRFLACSDLFDR